MQKIICDRCKKEIDLEKEANYKDSVLLTQVGRLTVNKDICKKCAIKLKKEIYAFMEENNNGIFSGLFRKNT
jgi:hypothetical protein